MHARLLALCGLAWAATVAHAQAHPKTAAISGSSSELHSFGSAYLVGFLVGATVLGVRAFRNLRGDFKAVRKFP